MTMKDGSKDNGKYCEVWQKKADGKWKIGLDMFSSDLPAQSGIFAWARRGGNEIVQESENVKVISIPAFQRFFR